MLVRSLVEQSFVKLAMVNFIYDNLTYDNLTLKSSAHWDSTLITLRPTRSYVQSSKCNERKNHGITITEEVGNATLKVEKR